MSKPEGYKRAGDDWDGFIRAWPFEPVPKKTDMLWCLHCERTMAAVDCLLDDADGLIECSFGDCDGSALDLSIRSGN